MLVWQNVFSQILNPQRFQRDQSLVQESVICQQTVPRPHLFGTEMLVLCYQSLVSPIVEWRQHQLRQIGRIQPAASSIQVVLACLQILQQVIHCVQTNCDMGVTWVRQAVPTKELRRKSVICSRIHSQALAGSAGGYLDNNANRFTF